MVFNTQLLSLSIGLILLGSACTKQKAIHDSQAKMFQSQTVQEVREQSAFGVKSNMVASASIPNQPWQFLKQTDPIVLHEQEAKLFDIPVPIGSQLIELLYQESSDQKAFIYSMRGTNISLFQFYQQEMERLGWKYTSAMQSEELMMMFDKPARFCTIIARPSKNKYIVTLYSGTKKQTLT